MSDRFTEQPGTLLADQGMIKSWNYKLARDALANAESVLSEEDYEDLLLHLDKQEPGFVREQYRRATKHLFGK